MVEYMTNIATEYLGLELKTPLVVSSNPLCQDIDNLKCMEELGAGAVVLPSLFEEQITLQSHQMSPDDTAPTLPPALSHLPSMKEYNKGTDGYLMQIYEAKKAVDMPIIASLNGTSAGGWVRYARLLASAGADAMELNIYYMPTSIESPGTEIENRFVHLVKEVKASVPIPVSVKLNPYFSSLPNMAAQLATAGADGLVLFNRFYQPDFDIENKTVIPSLFLSDSSELCMRLRWVSILYGRVKTDLAITGGIHSGSDVVKSMMAGASVAMLASSLLKNGVNYIANIKTGLVEWLEGHGHETVSEIRGLMSRQNVEAPAALERANYIEELSAYAARG
jgi:dihydroorotate dehydrogenase (fumarate)